MKIRRGKIKNLLKNIKFEITKKFSKNFLFFYDLVFYFSRKFSKNIGYEAVHRFGIKYGWILFANKKVFSFTNNIVFRINKTSNPDSIREICNNRSYFLLENDNSQLWQNNIDERFSELIYCLRNNKEKLLDDQLNKMFIKPFIHGVIYGNIKYFPNFKKVVALNILTQLVELGEYLNLSRAENPEQGEPAFTIRKDYYGLIKKIEDEIGISLNFPEIGSSWGLKYPNGIIIHGQIAHIYNALKIKSIIGKKKNVKLVEIGGGYGGLCYWLQKLCGNKISSYSIVDLNIVHCFQFYFLSQSFESVGINDSNKKINLVSSNMINNLKECDLVINQDSFPEMPMNSIKKYLDWAIVNSELLWSINQESYSPFNNEEQIWFSKLADSYKNIQRLSRNRSWVREGYVEELYSFKK